MSKIELVYGILYVIAFCGFIIGFLMMMFTTWYINHNKRRERLLELGYTKKHPWVGKKVDFFNANYMVSTMVPAAFAARWRVKRNLKLGIFATVPAITINENYQRLFDEFPFFVRWEVIKDSIGIFSFLIGGIAYSIEHGWW